MAEQVFPTKGNLLAVKKSLELAKAGYDLLDRKRNILIRETMSMMDAAVKLQEDINQVYAEAYQALQTANITIGAIDELAQSVPIDHGIQMTYRSVMGVEIPIVSHKDTPLRNLCGYTRTNAALDLAFVKFEQVKRMTIQLCEMENSVYRLANGIKKTQKRANALKNIIIPRFEETTKFITAALEEKDREEFSRLKVIKSTKQ